MHVLRELHCPSVIVNDRTAATAAPSSAAWSTSAPPATLDDEDDEDDEPGDRHAHIVAPSHGSAARFHTRSRSAPDRRLWFALVLPSGDQIDGDTHGGRAG